MINYKQKYIKYKYKYELHKGGVSDNDCCYPLKESYNNEKNINNKIWCNEIDCKKKDRYSLKPCEHIEFGKIISQKVEYLDTPEKRLQYEVLFTDGKLTNHQNENITTKPDDIHIFVWDGVHIYINYKKQCPYNEDRFHHSSFLAGATVKCAGHLKINNGDIVEMDWTSGHYTPTAGCICNLLTFLKKNNINIDNIKFINKEDHSQNINNYKEICLSGINELNKNKCISPVDDPNKNCHYKLQQNYKSEEQLNNNIWCNAPSCYREKHYNEKPCKNSKGSISQYVEYLNEIEKIEYKIYFSNGILNNNNHEIIHSGNWKIFVLDLNKTNLYVGNEIRCETPRFHHSSFLAGEAVSCAGDILIKNGIIQGLVIGSDHYKPNLGCVCNLLTYLKKNGVSDVNINMIKIYLDKDDIASEHTILNLCPNNLNEYNLNICKSETEDAYKLKKKQMKLIKKTNETN
jgi:hypothetical protein